jgi:hypothetical protein
MTEAASEAEGARTGRALPVRPRVDMATGLVLIRDVL